MIIKIVRASVQISQGYLTNGQSFSLSRILILLFAALCIFNNNVFAEHGKVSNKRYGFTENKGQFRDQYGNPNPDVLYVADFGGMKVLIRKDGFSYETYAVKPQCVDPATIPYKMLTFTPQGDTIESWPGKEEAEKNLLYHFHRIDVTALGANPGAIFIPEKITGDPVRHFFPQEHGRSIEVNTFEQIRVTYLYPGIDAIYYANNGHGGFKYDLVVHPDADLSQLVLEYKGMESIHLQDGNLMINTRFGPITENIPLCYYEDKAENRTPTNAFNFSLRGNNLSFEGNVQHNEDAMLVIDPAVSLFWAVNFGGNESDGSNGVAVDQFGNAYLVGNTKSSQNIATTGAYQDSLLILEDGYLTKFSKNGELQWSTYLNSSPAIDIDYKNDLVVLARDHIIKFDTSGNFIWQIKSMNGLKAISQDVNANIIAVGDTIIYDPVNDNYYDSDTIIKYNPTGVLQWARGYGGSHTQINDVGVDESGNIYIAGITNDSIGIATRNSHLFEYKGTNYSYTGHDYWLRASINAGDGFFAKLEPNGNTIYGSYYGGQYFDVINQIKVAHDGRFVITGETNSRTGIATSGVYQDSLNRQGKVCFSQVGINFGYNCENDGWPLLDTCIIGPYCMPEYDFRCQSTDAFIAMFNTDGTRKWGTYYGDNLSEYSTHISISQNLDTISIAGNSGHTCFDFPDNCPPHKLSTTYSIYQSGRTYIAQFDSTGKRLWGTYLQRGDSTIGGTSGPFCIVTSVEQIKDELLLAGSTSENDLLIPDNSFIDRFAIASMDSLIFPEYLSACIGDTINEMINIQSSSNQVFEFLWYKDNMILPDLNTANFTFQVNADDAGWYLYQIKSGNFIWVDSVYLETRSSPDFNFNDLENPNTNLNNIMQTADMNFNGDLYLITNEGIIYNNQLTFTQIDTLQFIHPEVSIVNFSENDAAFIFNHDPHFRQPNDNSKKGLLYKIENDSTTIIENNLLNGITSWSDFNNNGTAEGFRIHYTNETGGKFQLINIASDSIFIINAGSADYSHWANCFQKTMPGDFDNDGDIDLLFIGTSENDCNWIQSASILTNDDGIFSITNLSMIEKSLQMDAQWFDMNADGKLDIIFSKAHYTDSALWGNKILQVFLSENNSFSLFFSDTIVLPAQQQDVFLEPIVADIDLDGFFDIIFGKHLFLQTGSTFEKAPSSQGETNSGFIDNITGIGDFEKNGINYPFSRNGLYNSYPCNPPNTPPYAPQGLFTELLNDTVRFYWQRATDIETPQMGLTYNLRVGTTSGGSNIMSSMSDSTGWRRIVGMGNVYQNTGWWLQGLAPGTYYWSVQAIDNSYIGGPFAPEQTFIVEDYTLKRLSAKVFLEGAYNSGTLAMNNSLLSSNLIPSVQPYIAAPWNYSGEEIITTLPEGVIDWVLVELRQAASADLATEATIIEGWPKALLLKSDGSIVDVDNKNPLVGEIEITENLYVVIRHRNHLDVMSSAPLVLSGNTYAYDFTDNILKAYGGAAGYKQLADGVFGMVAGDIDADGAVFASDFNLWAINFGLTTVYLPADVDMDGQVFTSDFNKWALIFGTNNGMYVGARFRSQVP